MKKSIGIPSLVLVFVFSIAGFAGAVIHGGTISSDETWTPDLNPHIVNSLLHVINGATLTIEPGVEVRFNPDAINPRLIIGELSGTTGRLIARGTASQKIIFTSNADIPQPGDWNDIYFSSNAADDSIIENAIIEYGGFSGSIQIHSSQPTIKKCISRKSAGAGLYIYNSTAEISCCDFTENNIGIHYQGYENTPTIIYNNIFGNMTYGLQNSSSTDISAENNWWGDASGPSHASNPGGSGDNVSDNVDFDPWLTAISPCIFPKIKANGSDGPIQIAHGQPLSVTIELDAGNSPGMPADWWCVADTAFGWYYYHNSGTWRPGFQVSYQGPLFDLSPPLEVLNISDLPMGSYTFYFGIDGSSNGKLDQPLYYDDVEISITPP